jgi:hypothetical protein
MSSPAQSLGCRPWMCSQSLRSSQTLTEKRQWTNM